MLDNEYTFNDLCEGAVVDVEGDEVVVTSVVRNKDDNYVKHVYYLVEDEDEYRYWEEYFDEEDFNGYQYNIISVPSDEDKANYVILDNMLKEMYNLLDSYNTLAKTKGLDREAVLLSSKEDIMEWESSRC